MLAVVILVGLAVRKTGQSRTAHDTADSWQASDEIRPIPLELRRVPEVAVVKWGGLALLAFVAFRLPTFGFMDSGNLIKASAVVLFGIVGVSIIMLTGWAGQVTLGQMSVVGVGAVDRRAGHQPVGARPHRSPSSSPASPARSWR